ncbi:MAG: radical SAM protein [Clostridia bacterium]|nr:radical SAM protein [Clostridia bacterium]
MRYTGTTYRPPLEASSLLLQVTSGCSHNKCNFCTMYKDVHFSVEPMEQIEEDLKEAAEFYPYVSRIFLENGDPFVLSAAKLLEIAALIHKYLHNIKTISMYASILNVSTKTDDELKQLREAGINDLNIGVENGNDEALAYMQKGYTADEAIKQLARLKNAGFDYGINVIFGGLGGKRYKECADDTAELLNKAQPAFIYTNTMHSEPGCSLHDDLLSGKFIESTVEEYLLEEEQLIEKLDLKNTTFMGVHPSNILPLRGKLPRDKELFLEKLESCRKRTKENILYAPPKHGNEGGVVLA